jgi:guanylate kinase
MDELERRLRGRGTESEDSIKRRLGNAAREIEYGTQVGNFDRILVNNNLDDTVHEMITTLKLWYPQLNQHQADLG